MKIQIIHGSFEANEGMEILTQMIQVKIKFHENKIKEISSEEEIKMRENRIIKLQNDLFEIRNYIKDKNNTIDIEAEITLS